MATIQVYKADGSKLSQVEIDPKKLDKAVRRGLLKEAMIAHQASQRQGTHATKNRGEVAGGGKKPWRQKGTGRARQGSTRSPQWVGGGHAHAISPRDYSWRLPAQARATALRSALRFRLEANGMCAVDGLEGALKEPKTRAVAKFLGKIGLAGKGALLVSESNDTNLWLSARNLPKVSVAERRSLNAGQVMVHANLIFTKSVLDALVKEVSK